MAFCLPNVALPTSMFSFLFPRLDSLLLLALSGRLRVAPVSDDVHREDDDIESDRAPADPLLFVCFPVTTFLCGGFVFPVLDAAEDGLRPVAGDRCEGVCCGVQIE